MKRIRGHGETTKNRATQSQIYLVREAGDRGDEGTVHTVSMNPVMVILLQCLFNALHQRIGQLGFPRISLNSRRPISSNYKNRNCCPKCPQQHKKPCKDRGNMGAGLAGEVEEEGEEAMYGKNSCKALAGEEEAAIADNVLYVDGDGDAGDGERRCLCDVLCMVCPSPNSEVGIGWGDTRITHLTNELMAAEPETTARAKVIK